MTNTTHTKEPVATTNPAESPWAEAHQETQNKDNLAKRTIDQSSKKIRQAKDSVAESTHGLVEKAGEQYRNTSESAKRQYQRLSDQATETYSKSKTNVKHSFDEHPLAYLAGTFAVGLAAGLLLPRLSKEKEILAGPGEKLRDATNEVKQRATTATQVAKETANASLQEKGLDPDSVSHSLKDVGEESIDSAKAEFNK